MRCSTRRGGRGNKMGRKECLLALSEGPASEAAARIISGGWNEPLRRHFSDMWESTSMTRVYRRNKLGRTW